MSSDLPFHEYARQHGYTLSFYSTNRVQATYAKEGIYLTINDKGRASLSKNIKLAEVKIDDFQVPNKHFKIFEDLLHRIQEVS
jgi:hypothetical protein